MFKNIKLFKNFVENVKECKYTERDIDKTLQELPIKVLRKIGHEIIQTDYDGFNYISQLSKKAYFDDLDRDGKEFYIKERLYKLT